MRSVSGRIIPSETSLICLCKCWRYVLLEIGRPYRYLSIYLKALEFILGLNIAHRVSTDSVDL